jgi:hypothetical protein
LNNEYTSLLVGKTMRPGVNIQLVDGWKGNHPLLVMDNIRAYSHGIQSAIDADNSLFAKYYSHCGKNYKTLENPPQNGMQTQDILKCAISIN